MTQDEYLSGLQKKFERNFVIERDIKLLGEDIDIIAKYSNISGRTFITKYDVIDKCENYEYCYIKKYDYVTEKDAEAFGRLLKQIADEFVKPSADHMSTYVTGIMVANSISDDAKKVIEKYSYSKVYFFYLKGWCDVRFICAGMENNELITNKAGKRVRKVYQPNP